MLDYAKLKPGDECVLVGKGRFFGLLSAVVFDERMKRYIDRFDEYTDKKRSSKNEKTDAGSDSEARANGQ
jgi:hypothetical protein